MKIRIRFVCILALFLFILSAPAGLPKHALADGSNVPLSSLQAGDTVSFANYSWTVLDPATGYLIMRGDIGSGTFDLYGNTPKFNPAVSTNLAYRLNNSFYNSLPANDRAMILPHEWTIGPTDGSQGYWDREGSETVICKIGLISYDEYTYNTTYRNACQPTPGTWWTRTPDASTSNCMWALPDYKTLGESAVVRPALYLNPGALVSLGTVTDLPLSHMGEGDVVRFASRQWIILYRGSGYFLLKDSLGPMAFDTANGPAFNPGSPTNIAYYLNQTFLNGIAPEDRARIMTHTWSVGSEANEGSGTVSCPIGLASYSDYLNCRAIPGVSDPSLLWWTLTSSSSSSGYIWCISPTGSILGVKSDVGTVHARPAIHMDPGGSYAFSGTGAVVVPGPADQSQSSVEASQPGVTADGVAFSTITVTLKDAIGIPIYGKTISLAQDGGSSVITDVNAITDADGVATFTVTDTTAESVTYTATDITASPAWQLTDTANVQFTPGPVDAGMSSVTASAPECPAGANVTGVTVTVALRDAFGNAVPGRTVSLSQGVGHSAIQEVRAATDTSGTAAFTVTDTTAETVTYTATDVTDDPDVAVTQSAQVRFLDSVEMLLDTLQPGATVYFGGYEWIVLDPGAGYLLMKDSLKDAGGNTAAMVFDTSIDIFDPARSTSVAFWLNHTFLDSFPSTDQDAIQPHDWTTGRTPATVNCKIGLISRDEYSGYTTGGTFCGTINTIPDCWWTRTYSGLHDYGTFWAVNSNGSMNDNIACVLPNAVRPTLYLSPDDAVRRLDGGETGLSTVESTLAAVPADGSTSSAVVVTLKDANGVAMPGRAVRLSSLSSNTVIVPPGGGSGGGTPGAPASAVTDGSGSATFTVTDTTAETVTFTATDTTADPGLQLTQTAQVSFLGTGCAITAFRLDGVAGNVRDGTVAVTVPTGTDLGSLAAVFTLSPGAAATVNGLPQTSGVTANDFTHAVTYTVLAQDGVHTRDWTVTVQQASLPATGQDSSPIWILGSLSALCGATAVAFSHRTRKRRASSR